MKIYDNDRFLCSLFAPEEGRRGLFAVYAFNLEVAKVREVTSEAVTGLIRLQWWREAIEGIYAEQVRDHEVVQELAALLNRRDISKTLYDTVIDAREKDLDAFPFADIGVLEKYAKETAGALMLLALEVLGVEDEKLKEAAEHIGTAWALVGLMRSARLHIRQGFLFFPEEMQSEHRFSKDIFGSDAFVEHSQEATKEIIALVETHLEAAGVLREQVSDEVCQVAAPVLLLRPIAELFVKRIKKAEYDLYTQDLEKSRLGMQLRIFRNGMLKRY